MGTPMREVPVDDRPRERLLRRGISVLSDAELVAIQLGSGHASASALEVANELIATWGGIGSPGGCEAGRAGAGDCGRAGPGRPSGRRLRHCPPSRRFDGDCTPLEFERHRTGGTTSAAAGSRGTAGGLDHRRWAPTASHRDRRDGLRDLVPDAGTRSGGHDASSRRGRLRRGPQPPRRGPHTSSADRSATSDLRDAARVTGLRFLDHVVIAGTEWRSVAT
jgi:DNA repair protein RadC